MKKKDKIATQSSGCDFERRGKVVSAVFGNSLWLFAGNGAERTLPRRGGASVLTAFERADPILIKIEAQRSGFNFGRKGSRTSAT